MLLKALALSNFRSHSNSFYEFSSGTNFITGSNGSGKTNILEAIYILSTGKTFLPHSFAELISWQQNFSTIQGKLETDDTHKLEVQLIKEPQKTNISRVFKLDDIKKTRPKYAGILKAVVFQPDDLRLITGSPTRRRDYLDDILENLHWQYASSTTSYNKALKHRNELLDFIFLNKATPDQLHFWDSELIKNGQVICSYRKKFLDFVNNFFKNHSNPEISALSIDYFLSLLTASSLTANYEFDLRRGSTQVGPHRDDYVFHSALFKTQDTTLESWASRGQERLAILALKLAQIEYINHTFSQKPILLLDDIFSELDREHWQLVLQVCSSHQSFITSAQPELAQILNIKDTIKL